MKRISTLFIVLIFAGFVTKAQEGTKVDNSNKLAVVWTSGDRDVAEKVCLMYTHAAKTAKWFDEVVLILWGPASKLLVEDEKLQEKVKKMAEDGVVVRACIACARMYGIVDDLKALDIEVTGMGAPLTEYLKTDWKVLTF